MQQSIAARGVSYTYASGTDKTARQAAGIINSSRDESSMRASVALNESHISRTYNTWINFTKWNAKALWVTDCDVDANLAWWFDDGQGKKIRGADSQHLHGRWVSGWFMKKVHIWKAKTEMESSIMWGSSKFNELKSWFDQGIIIYNALQAYTRSACQ